MNLDELSMEEIKNGYVANEGGFTCMVCGAAFANGEVYPCGGRYFDALHMVQRHVEIEHGPRLEQLLASDSKYVTLTSNQKKVFTLFAAGLSDAEVAAQLGVTASTVRHHRFTFREKAKQAKMYLALYALAFEQGGQGTEALLPVHDSAKMLDDRYLITVGERDKILRDAFTSLSPLKLSHFPVKEKKKVAILAKIAEQFEQGRRYAESEVNQILQEIFDDYVTLRRYLIEYGFMERTKDCSEYWMHLSIQI